MTNHDVALVIALWVLVLIVWGAVILHDRMQRPEPDVEAPEPELEPESEPRYRPCTRDELTAIAHNPNAPAVIRYMAATQLHNNGWCTCGQPYNQDAELTDTDIDWLNSQGGAS